LAGEFSARRTSRKSGELVQNQRTSDGHVERVADTHHGDLHYLIQKWPHLRWEPGVLVPEEDDASIDGLANRTE
jgi:hypothetical protein